MRHLRIGAAVALAAFAVLTAVLAVQAWRYPGTAAREDALLDRRPAGAWEHDGGVIAAITGARDDARFRRAIALYHASRPQVPGGNKTAAQVVAGLESVVLLARVVRDEGAPALRSSAANLAGILLAEDAVFEPDGRQRVVRALELFRQAVALDPTNAAAKTNLELLYGYSGVETSAADEGSGFGELGGDAGAGRAGSGY